MKRTTSIAAKNIKQRRIDSKLSQKELAKKLGLFKDQISKIENGKRQVSAYELGAMEMVLGWKASEILGIEPDNSKLSACLRVKSDYSGDEAPFEEIQKWTESVIEVDDLLDKVYASNKASINKDYFSKEEISSEKEAMEQGAKKAKQILDGLNIEHNTSFEWANWIETVLKIDVNFGSFPECLPVDAVSLTDCKSFGMITINSSSHEWKARENFTLLHEVGHILFQDNSDNCSKSLSEKRADAFAGEMILPSNVLPNILDADSAIKIFENFQASYKVLQKNMS